VPLALALNHVDALEHLCPLPAVHCQAAPVTPAPAPAPELTTHSRPVARPTRGASLRYTGASAITAPVSRLNSPSSHCPSLTRKTRPMGSGLTSGLLRQFLARPTSYLQARTKSKRNRTGCTLGGVNSPWVRLVRPKVPSKVHPGMAQARPQGAPGAAPLGRWVRAPGVVQAHPGKCKGTPSVRPGPTPAGHDGRTSKAHLELRWVRPERIR
jgi:hypothetical protein